MMITSYAPRIDRCSSARRPRRLLAEDHAMHRINLLSFALVSVFLAAINLGCATDRSVIANAADMDTTLKPAEMNDRQLSDYLQSVGERIIAAAKEADEEKVGPKSHFDKKQ